MEKLQKAAVNSEKLSARLAEDVFETVDLNNKKLEEFDERLSQLKEWVSSLNQYQGKYFKNSKIKLNIGVNIATENIQNPISVICTIKHNNYLMDTNTRLTKCINIIKNKSI